MKQTFRKKREQTEKQREHSSIVNPCVRQPPPHFEPLDSIFLHHLGYQPYSVFERLVETGNRLGRVLAAVGAGTLAGSTGALGSVGTAVALGLVGAGNVLESGDVGVLRAGIAGAGTGLAAALGEGGAAVALGLVGARDRLNTRDVAVLGARAAGTLAGSAAAGLGGAAAVARGLLGALNWVDARDLWVLCAGVASALARSTRAAGEVGAAVALGPVGAGNGVHVHVHVAGGLLLEVGEVACFVVYVNDLLGALVVELAELLAGGCSKSFVEVGVETAPAGVGLFGDFILGVDSLGPFTSFELGIEIG